MKHNYIKLLSPSDAQGVVHGPRKRSWRVERMEDLVVARNARGPRPLTAAEIVAKFETLFVRNNDNECWPWIGTTKQPPFNYGRFYVNCGEERAHRISWIIYRGDIPTGLHALHHCDNPVCVNPHHLFLGDADANKRDCLEKGRSSPPPHHLGSMHPHSKLNEEQVAFIRHEYESTNRARQIQLAGQFGITVQNIRLIGERRSWKHLP